MSLSVCVSVCVRVLASTFDFFCMCWRQSIPLSYALFAVVLCSTAAAAATSVRRVDFAWRHTFFSAFVLFSFAVICGYPHLIK